MTAADLRLLACPTCHGPLRLAEAAVPQELRHGRLVCDGCRRRWPIERDLPRLVEESRLERADWWMRLVYDWFAPFHDPGVRFVLPLLQWSSEETLRDGYMRRLALERLEEPGDGTPVRILEVGIGCGANLPLIERDLPAGVAVELWGVDLSEGMLRQCRRRLTRYRRLPVKLLFADAHALPFADATFDRVFHVGGIAGFGNPRLALAEMARVARPGTPIVVVDEQLDPRVAQGCFHRLAYRALTLLAPSHGSPRAHLPTAARDVVDEQISRFYYSLSFRMPPA